MSDPKVQLARRGLQALERGDLDAVIAMLDPDIVAYDPPEIPDSSVHRGREAVRRDWEETFEMFEDFSIELERYFDAGDELVVFVRYRGRMRGSTSEVEAVLAHVWTYRDGKVSMLRQYLDRAEALKAVGLSEDDGESF
jgi:uncharacterized protein